MTPRLDAQVARPYTIRHVSRLLHLVLALFLVVTTGLAHALPAGLGCEEEGPHTAEETKAPCDCCEHEAAEGAGSWSGDGCGDGCAFCVCCPVRTAITSTVPAPPAPTLVEAPAPPGYHARVSGSPAGDNFQPPRA